MKRLLIIQLKIEESETMKERLGETNDQREILRASDWKSTQNKEEWANPIF